MVEARSWYCWIIGPQGFVQRSIWSQFFLLPARLHFWPIMVISVSSNLLDGTMQSFHANKTSPRCDHLITNLPYIALLILVCKIRQSRGSSKLSSKVVECELQISAHNMFFIHVTVCEWPCASTQIVLAKQQIKLKTSYRQLRSSVIFGQYYFSRQKYKKWTARQQFEFQILP